MVNRTHIYHRYSAMFYYWLYIYTYVIKSFKSTMHMSTLFISVLMIKGKNNQMKLFFLCYIWVNSYFRTNRFPTVKGSHAWASVNTVMGGFCPHTPVLCLQVNRSPQCPWICTLQHQPPTHPWLSLGGAKAGEWISCGMTTPLWHPSLFCFFYSALFGIHPSSLVHRCASCPRTGMSARPHTHTHAHSRLWSKQNLTGGSHWQHSNFNKKLCQGTDHPEANLCISISSG